MKEILQEPLSTYNAEKRNPFGGNSLAAKFRNQYPELISSLLKEETRYKIDGSAGKGNWTECPWIGIFDLLITNTAQSGYYPVYLFKADMSGVYLSLNQGVTEVIENYKTNAINVLTLRAADYRAKLELNSESLIETIDLKSKTKNARHYAAGNIIAKNYEFEDLPDDEVLIRDLRYFLRLYDQLIYSDQSNTDGDSNLEVFEKKQLRLHWRIERNSSIPKEVKRLKGYKCEGCGFKFTDLYGELGKKFIEAHHLTPISELDINRVSLNPLKDFAVLCSNCHRMIHRLEDPSNLNKLQEIIRSK